MVWLELLIFIKQEQQQKAISAFNKVHADAWASVIHRDYLSLPKKNPAFVAQAQQAFSGLNEQQRNDMGDLAMRANVALSGTGSLTVNSLLTTSC